MTISQINQTESVLVPLSCSRGLECVIENYVGGIIFSTEILGSMNLTVNHLSEIQVKDPNYMSKYWKNIIIY